ncbi:O-methyltransferase [Nitrosomonas sp. HPC101]|uniref:O-methyltransferase n=1 Tax=Nitrosomonas sp. HPC101 TaxID=1658667 RepID=UPI00136C57D8|nr:O-methyltransferase [Nitrosomonas sp. HPC101]MXS86176.1 O-methyltransferase [Nitrosomonas sp. HPC101]
MSTLQPPVVNGPNGLIPVDPVIEQYMRTLAGQFDHSILDEMEAFAQEKDFPIVGRLVGISLEIYAKMIGARKVFEFGSGYGYSAYWFGRAVGPEGQVICTDSNPLNQKKAEQYLAATGLWERVKFCTGYAQDIFVQTDGVFDICYNDADKSGYPDIWLMARERIRPGGLYIADNVLWHGRVAMNDGPVEVKPGGTEAIREHNQLICNDPEFDAFINPTRDGVIVARRKMA